MKDSSQKIVVSQILDSRPRIFSLPVSIIFPLAMVGTGSGLLAYIIGLTPYAALMLAVACVVLYFFLFGQEGWRLIAKFRRPPEWVRSDIRATPFTLRSRNETKAKIRKNKATRRKRVQSTN